MDKNSLTDLLKSKDVVLQKHGKELDFLRLALERINDRDFEGLNQLASQNTISLDPLGRVLEGGTVEYIKSSLILRCYEYMVLESIFSGRAESDNLLDLCGAALLDDSSIRELHLLMSSVPFADKQVSRLKDMIEEQGLNNLQDYIWDKGLEEFFNERCRKIGQEASERLSVQEVTEKVSLQEIFEEAQLAESFVYKDIKNSRAKGQVETDLVLEAGSRNRMEALINKLYSWFESYPGDFSQLKLVLEELHMERQVKTIELKGIEAFRKYLSDSWAVGALKVAHRFGFSWPGSSSEDKQASLSKVNASFLKQAKKSSRGKAFLLWEGILHSVRKFYAAKAFIFPGRYVLVQFQPADDESHFLFGQYISQDEQKAFIMRCLS
ncbi:MAG: hypothetical protein U9P14_05665, partial [Gemmatimonadota bacterium]|nr:hypothetical protein [Gemmatimonadota bacterium]